MEAGLKDLKCGVCGEKNHELFLRASGEIITECTKCKTRSLITLTQPKINIEFLEGKGIICAF